MSNPPGGAERTARALFRLGFWLPLAACTWLALTPSPPEAVFRVGDVVLHALAFAYLTFALGLAHHALGRWRIVVCMLAYGLFLEVAQSFGPTRSPEIKDLLVDSAGIAAGVGALAALGAWAERTLRRTLTWLGMR